MVRRYPDPQKCEVLRKRHELFKKIRHYFDSRDFTEIHTPLLVPNPGLEPELIPFETSFEPGMGGGSRQELYLPTSPEYHLKKALALGFDKIYEITRSFRNGETSSKHEPEFFMMEWYRNPGELEDIATDFSGLCAELGTGDWQKRHDISVEQAFQDWAGLDLRGALAGTSPPLTQQALANNCPSIQAQDSFEDCFHKILLDFIEPKLGRDGLTFLWHYPASLCAMARLKPGDPLFCERFEVYWKGHELGNAFAELTQPLEQRERCLDDQMKRRTLYGKTPNLDEDFFAALGHISGPAAGIAVGVDRLLQNLLDLSSIQEIIAFPFRK